jgi:Flp pilus assembly protein TadG
MRQVQHRKTTLDVFKALDIKLLLMLLLIALNFAFAGYTFYRSEQNAKLAMAYANEAATAQGDNLRAQIEAALADANMLTTDDVESLIAAKTTGLVNESALTDFATRTDVQDDIKSQLYLRNFMTPKEVRNLVNKCTLTETGLSC